MSEQLTIRELHSEDEEAFLRAVVDWGDEDLSWLTFHWNPTMSHAEHLKILHEQKVGINVPDDFVPSTMLYGFINGKIVGRVHLRHRLNDNLMLRGGHMGYAVTPKYRRRGYGHALAKAGVWYLKEHLKIKDVLITCNDKHQASIHIIEHLGARLENITPDLKGVMTRRYWI